MSGLIEKVRRLFWAFENPTIPQELQEDVRELQDMLGDSGERFLASPVALALAWFPTDGREDYGRQMMSDIGVESGPTEVRDAFSEEIQVLCDIIEEDLPSDKPQERMHRELAKRAQAMHNWHRLGVPFRADRDAMIFHIAAPRDLMGSPLISSMSLRSFLPLVAEKSAWDTFRVTQLQKQVEFWRVAAIICAVILVIVLV